jgi:chitinase
MSMPSRRGPALAAVAVLAAFASALAGCSDDDGSNANHPPVAVVAPTASVALGYAAVLDGGASLDVDGDEVTWSWTLAARPAGSAAVLALSDASRTALVPDVEGSYVVTLRVSDGVAQSAPAMAIVTAVPSGQSGTSPVAQAGADRAGRVGAPVTLDGSGSSDPLGRTLLHAWSVVARPAGSAAELANAETAHPTFTPDVEGTFVLSLTVTAQGGPSATDTVTVLVGNRAPVASAGGNRQAYVRQAVTLDGSASVDPDGDAITFSWRIAAAPAGSVAALTGGATATPAFTPDLVGSYEVEVTVTDSSGATAVATAVVSATNPTPVANPVPSISVYLGTAVTLDANATALDGEPMSYAWALATRPTGSAAALTGETTATPAIAPDLAGIYILSLVVSDAGGAAAPVTVTVTAYPPIRRLTHRVLDAEYSRALDRVVMVAASPNALYVYDPATGDEQTVFLALAPTAVSVAPDGLTAVVGHNAFVSYVDLQSATLTNTISVAAVLGDVVLAGNGFAYLFPLSPSFDVVHALDLASGAETKASAFLGFQGTRARLHPSGTRIYGADNGVSPADLRRFDISGASVTGGTERYHGSYAICGNLWLSEDGARIFTACGNVFRALDTYAAGDLEYAGALEATSSVQHLDDSTAAGKVLAIPKAGWSGTGDDRSIRVFGAEFLTQQESIPTSPFLLVDGRSFVSHGRFVFWSADSTRRFAIVQADATSALLQDYGVMEF